MVHPEERLLPAEFIEELQAKGLVGGALPFFISSHIGYPSGYLISLPESAGGNVLFDEKVYTRDDQGQDQLTRMPTLTLWGEAGDWNISAWEWVPGPGPGDFKKKLVSLDEALAKIMSYFFDPNDHHFIEIKLAICQRHPKPASGLKEFSRALAHVTEPGILQLDLPDKRSYKTKHGNTPLIGRAQRY